MSPARQPERDESVSLAPLTPEEALRALLAVKPDDEPVDDTKKVIDTDEQAEK